MHIHDLIEAGVADMTERLFYIIFSSLVLLIAGCSEDNKGPSNIIELRDDVPVNESFRTTILLSDSAWTKAIIEAGHARKYDQGERRETLIDSGLYIRFLNRDGGINVILKADSARLDDVTGDMCAFGRVNVYSKRNRTAVDTDKLCYDKEK